MKTKLNILIALLCFGLMVGCNMDEEWHDKVTPGTFFKNKQDIAAAIYRPFTHARWYVGGDRWQLQEQSADHFVITTKGPHWDNGGENKRLHYHTWTPDEGKIWEAWRGTLMGIALALDVKTDLVPLNYEALALTEEDKKNDINQLNTLIAYFYLRGLDYFGGLPVFTDLNQENVPRSTDLETFRHVETLLKEALTSLSIKEEGKNEEGTLRQGAAAAMLAQLYFNAEAYIGQDMYTECAKICRDILNGVYGPYKLDPTWNGPHGFSNDKSPEIIWSTPSELNKLQYDWFYSNFYHYNTRVYFDIDGGADNGQHLQPSRRPDSTLYSTEFKLGSPYEKFHQQDLRKAPYHYLGGGKYTGLFLVGKQISPTTGQSCMGTQEYKDKLIVFDDRVGLFSKLKPGEYPPNSESIVNNGEENTGIRLVKVPTPTTADKNLRWGADNPVIRLTEIQYMLAECTMRAGDKASAATLINEVRSRNFAGVDPDPVTAVNLDKYRMLDEWGIEFLGEGRRRTDLIRWDEFVTGSWWDHQPTGSSTDKHLNRFPIPTKAMSGNNNLKQNPGY